MNSAVMTAEDAVDTKTSKKSFWRPLLMVSVPILLLIVGGYFWLTAGRFVATDNAYVAQDKVSVAAEIAGTISAVHVRENQQVRKGDLLFVIDQRPYRIALAQAEAQIAAAEVQVHQLQTRSAGTGADIKGAGANLAFTQKEFARYAELLDRGFTTRARYEQAEHAVQEARERLANAEADAAVARAALASGGAGNQPAIEAAKVAREKALLDLQRTEVRAPADGYVSQADRLQVGNTVVAGIPVVTIVRSGEAWVEANYKETDLAGMAVGQPAEIELDAYPGLVVHGHVASVGAGTGSEFSLLPPQNATGNWVKVTQRVPVRIAFDETPARPMIAGLSAEVTVDTKAAADLQIASR